MDPTSTIFHSSINRNSYQKSSNNDLVPGLLESVQAISLDDKECANEVHVTNASFTSVETSLDEASINQLPQSEFSNCTINGLDTDSELSNESIFSTSSFINFSRQIRMPIPSSDFEAFEDTKYEFEIDMSFFFESMNKSLIQSKDLESFRQFYENKSSNSKEMYLEYLLPLVTATESVTTDQFKAIDDFLMPIWTFNKYTAKDKLSRDDMIVIVNAIRDPELNLDKIVPKIEAIINKNGFQNTSSLGANLNTDLTNTINTSKELPLVLKFIKQMNTIYNSSPSDDVNSGANLKATNLQYSKSFRRLYDEFLDSCCDEKEPGLPEKDEERHRINSGGCKLMVQGISDILGIGDPEEIIDRIEFDPYSDDDDQLQIKEQLMSLTDQLLHLQGKANIDFNDGISLFKEIVEGEIGEDQLFTNRFYGVDESADINTKKDKIRAWFKQKMDKYCDCLEKYQLVLFQIRKVITDNNLSSEATRDLNRYIDLISSAMIGVPLWSCFLTNRYYLVTDGEPFQADKLVDQNIAQLKACEAPQSINKRSAKKIDISNISSVFEYITNSRSYHVYSSLISKLIAV